MEKNRGDGSKFGEIGFDLFGGCGCEFAVYGFSIREHFLELGECVLGSGEGFFGAAEFFIREVFDKIGAVTADTEAPAFEGRVLVGESREVFLRFHGLRLVSVRFMLGNRGNPRIFLPF
jgi:hypothetical protein